MNTITLIFVIIGVAATTASFMRLVSWMEGVR
jgi:hypothetical protein